MSSADRNGANDAAHTTGTLVVPSRTATAICNVADLLSEALAREDLNDVREPIAALTRGLHAYAAALAAI